VAGKVFQRNAFQNRAESNFHTDKSKYHTFQIFQQPTVTSAQHVGPDKGFKGMHADRGS